jgi:hypothetical protein
MSNRLKDKNRRARMSLQNRELFKNQMNKIIDNMGLKKNEPEVTEEEDPLKFFSQQQRKKEKEEERKKYLLPITEEDDPLNFFKNQDNEEKEQDPLKFIKQEELAEGAPKVLGNLAKHDEEKLAEAILKNDIPEEVIVNKKERSDSGDKEKRKKKMDRRMKTALRFSQRPNIAGKTTEKLLQRLQEKKPVNPEINVKQTGNEQSGNTLLSADEQIDPANNTTKTIKTKEIDLKNFMGK